MLSPKIRGRIGWILCVVSLLELVSAAAIILLGGYSFRYGPFRLTAHDLLRTFLLAAAAGAGAAALLGRDELDARAARVLVVLERRAVWLAAIVALAVFIIGIREGTRCACGADAYGYISQSHLWANGSLHVPQPLASVLRWPSIDWVLSPLGYRPATHPGAIVPTYPPGLPLAMAIAQMTMGTRSAVYEVVPLLGAVAVWSTFLLGRRIDTAIVGTLGALTLACSATFLFHLILPMSDVPVTAWWLLAAALALRPGTVSVFFAGLACSAAVLTRPNLVPLVVVFIPFVAGDMQRSSGRSAGVRRLSWFGAGVLPGIVAVAWIHDALYGSPLRSGYGRLEDLYSSSNVRPNLRLYVGWLWQSRAVLPFVAVGAPVVWVGASDRVPFATRRGVWFGLIFSAVLLAAYLFYSSFEVWTYTRFLLPAIALTSVIGSWVLFALARRLRSPALQALAAIVIVLLVCRSAAYVVEGRILEIPQGDSRYLATAKYIADTTSADATIVSMQHSGSLRYYAGRTTLRYDWIDPRILDAAIRELQVMHRAPLIVLDDWEERRFRERFSGQTWGALDWPPRAAVESRPRVLIYDPLDRGRYLENGAVETIRLPQAR